MTLKPDQRLADLFSDDDLIWPPPLNSDETDDEKAARLEEEREAKRVSDAIDRGLISEKEQRKKPDATILLLGQSESGKSTILKNMQLHFAPKAFAAEAEFWRPIVHLNLLRSVNFILAYLKGFSARPGSPTTYPAGALQHHWASEAAQGANPKYPKLSDEIRCILIRLTPLKQVEESLTKRMSVLLPDSSGPTQYNPHNASEVSVRGGKLKRFLKLSLNLDSSERGKNYNNEEDMQNRRIIAACAGDISQLWNDKDVQFCLNADGITLRDQSGFFLDDVERISQEDYSPLPEDILRARVKTIGPEEHRILMESEQGKEWIVYDVGGSRNQRAAWAQFFDDVTAIIFLAPISAFNQVLIEDDTMNRLADSLKLWRLISSNKLLATVNMVLFLNKMDILDMQLKSGIRFAKYVTSYKERPNETKEVAKYLIDVFAAIHNQVAPMKRRIHIHLTCATDTKATSTIIVQIRDTLLVKALAQTHIL